MTIYFRDRCGTPLDYTDKTPERIIHYHGAVVCIQVLRDRLAGAIERIAKLERETRRLRPMR